jgi:hypothetical protein
MCSKLDLILFQYSEMRNTFLNALFIGLLAALKRRFYGAEFVQRIIRQQGGAQNKSKNC